MIAHLRNEEKLGRGCVKTGQAELPSSPCPSWQIWALALPAGIALAASAALAPATTSSPRMRIATVIAAGAASRLALASGKRRGLTADQAAPPGTERSAPQSAAGRTTLAAETAQPPSAAVRLAAGVLAVGLILIA